MKIYYNSLIKTNKKFISRDDSHFNPCLIILNYKVTYFSIKVRLRRLFTHIKKANAFSDFISSNVHFFFVMACYLANSHFDSSFAFPLV